MKSPRFPTSIAPPDLSRLENHLSGDAGLFVLAACSYVEGYLSYRYPETARSKLAFRERIVSLRYDLKLKKSLTREDHDLFNSLVELYPIATAVRHRFLRVDEQEALAAAHAIARFALLVGCCTEVADRLQLAVSRSFESQDSAEPAELVRDLEAQAVGIASDENQVVQSNEHSPLFVEYMQRFSFLTRTRSDYLRGVMQLTAEQQDALRQIAGVGDYLITGAAGTGKTIVLLHALKRSVEQQSLDFDTIRPTVLLTYSHALVRFNTWIARMIGAQASMPMISTVDAFIDDRWKILDPDRPIDHSLVEDVLVRQAPTHLSLGDLVQEVDSVVLASGCTYADYIDPSSRHHSWLRLSVEQKREVWAASERVRERCARGGTVSPGFARGMLRQALARPGPESDQLRVKRVFLDEAQDVGVYDLGLLKGISREGIVVAGDRSQAIWRLGLSYRQAGIMVQGRAKILRTVFRNIQPISQLATAWRDTFPPRDNDGGADIGVESTAITRDGPIPRIEFVPTSAISGRVIELIRFYNDELSYDVQSLAVLTLFRQEAASIAERLRSNGIPVSDVRSDAFDFDSSPGVRVCSVRAAKGIEFPIVLLTVSSLDFLDSKQRPEVEALFLNTMYVGMTRAMDHLVFVASEETRHSESMETINTTLQTIQSERT